MPNNWVIESENPQFNQLEKFLEIVEHVGAWEYDNWSEIFLNDLKEEGLYYDTDTLEREREQRTQLQLPTGRVPPRYPRRPPRQINEIVSKVLQQLLIQKNNKIKH